MFSAARLRAPISSGGQAFTAASSSSFWISRGSVPSKRREYSRTASKPRSFTAAMISVTASSTARFASAARLRRPARNAYSVFPVCPDDTQHFRHSRPSAAWVAAINSSISVLLSFMLAGFTMSRALTGATSSMGTSPFSRRVAPVSTMSTMPSARPKAAPAPQSPLS